MTMLHRFKTQDCPDANGRTPDAGELKWTLTFPLENGDILHVEIGERARDALRWMMRQEERDDRNEAAKQ
jgi:hypothetical protein